jgi:hypothetical protein
MVTNLGALDGQGKLDTAGLSWLGLGGGRTEVAAAAPYTLTKLLTFLGSHVGPAPGHTAAVGAVKAAPTHAAEEDPAQRQKPNRLPESEQAPAKERRQQPVPKLHYDFAADGDKQRHPYNRRRYNPNHFLHFRSHVQSLMLS